MATSPSDQNNQNVLAWLDRLESSVRTAGSSGGPSAFGLGSRTEPESTEEEEDDSDNEEQDEPTERGSTAGTIKVEEDDKSQSLPDSAVPLGLIAELSLGSKSKGSKGRKPAKDEDDTDDDNVVRARFHSSFQGMVDWCDCADDYCQGVANKSYFRPGKPFLDIGSIQTQPPPRSCR